MFSINLETVKYVTEVPLYMPVFKAELAALPMNASVREAVVDRVIMEDVGAAVFGGGIYDLATFPGAHSKSSEGRTCQTFSGFSMFLLRLLNAAVDDPQLGLAPAERRHFLTSSIDTILNPEASVASTSYPETETFLAAVGLGKAINQAIARHSSPLPWRIALREYQEAEASHGEDGSPEGILASSEKVGQASGGIMAASIEVVRNQHSPNVRLAARCLGAYGACHDHAYEQNRDLQAGTVSLVAAQLQNGYKSLSQAKKEARRMYLEASSSAAETGLAVLTAPQRSTYKAMQNMIDYHYKGATRFKDSLRQLNNWRIGKQANR